MTEPRAAYDDPPLSILASQKALDDLASWFADNGSWITRETDGLTYWGSGLATRVSYGPPTSCDGSFYSRVRIVTDLVREASVEGDSHLAGFSRANLLNAPLPDPAGPGRIRLHAGFWAFHDVFPTINLLLGKVVLLQAAEAARTAPAAASLVGGTPDVTPHPERGVPAGRDPFLAAMEAEFRRAGGYPCRWPADDFGRLAQLFRDPPCLEVNADDCGLTAEFPFLGESCLLRLVSNHVHPVYGRGLRLSLDLPTYGLPADRRELARRLNRGEREHPPGVHFFGAWRPSDYGVVFEAFLPNWLGSDSRAHHFATSMVIRAHWVAHTVFNDDWTRVPGTTAAQRALSTVVPS
jgi:hypothetical protein